MATYDDKTSFCRLGLQLPKEASETANTYENLYRLQEKHQVKEIYLDWGKEFKKEFRWMINKRRTLLLKSIQRRGATNARQE